MDEETQGEQTFLFDAERARGSNPLIRVAPINDIARLASPALGNVVVLTHYVRSFIVGS